MAATNPVVPEAVSDSGVPPQRGGAWRILFGADGLRAGWSLLLFAALIILLLCDFE